MIFKKYAQFFSVLILLATVYLSFYTLMPLAKNDKKNIVFTEFSSYRALNHLQKISKKPHFTGSIEHAVVRKYIIDELEKLGLKVEVQEQVAINKKWRAASKTKNILSKIKGSGNGKALLLLAHYDSNPHSSLGAADAGSGVVTILEGVRAFLATNKQPKNDIIICITDAEELGLLGANAFVNHHPWAKNIGLVLNFEARGSGGPSYMLLETNGGNKKLIEAFSKAKTLYPVANSLMYSIYKMLPNDTDLTVFREDGNINGFNFAFIGDHFDYHTVQDSFDRMDKNTFEHQASYLMPLLHYFANNNLENYNAKEDYVYFNFPYFGLVFYPFSWVIPLFGICVVLFFMLLFIGFLNKKLTFLGVLKGFIPLALSLLVSSFIAIYGWKAILKIHPQYNDILQGFTYNGYIYITAFVLLTLASCFWLYQKYFKKISNQNLVIAPLFFWLLINGGISFYLQGAAFFILPVIVLLLVLSILIFSNTNKNTTLLFTILSIPVLLIFGPLVKMFPVGLGLKMMIISTVFTALLFGFLVPVFFQYKFQKIIVKIFLLLGILTVVFASFFSMYSESRKQPNSILYVLDTNKNEAYWASYNAKIDEFTKQFLGKNPIKGSYDGNILASKYKTGIKIYKKTVVKNFRKPTIKIISDTIINNNRKVILSIESHRNANKIELLTKLPIRFKSFKINKEAIKKSNNKEYVFSVRKGTIMSYYITSQNEKIELELEVDKDQQFDIDILEAKYDLFTNSEFNITPRTTKMMPTPFVLNDVTVIKTNLKF